VLTGFLDEVVNEVHTQIRGSDSVALWNKQLQNG